jgi:hypothetical protein
LPAPPRPSPIADAGSDPPIVRSVVPSRKHHLAWPTAWPIMAAPSPKCRRVHPPSSRPLLAPVKIGHGSRADGSVYGRRSTATHRAAFGVASSVDRRGSRLSPTLRRFLGVSPAIAGAPCAPPPLLASRPATPLPVVNLDLSDMVTASSGPGHPPRRLPLLHPWSSTSSWWSPPRGCPRGA